MWVGEISRELGLDETLDWLQIIQPKQAKVFFTFIAFIVADHFNGHLGSECQLKE